MPVRVLGAVAVGLCDYESLRAHHEPQTIRDSDSYMDPPRSALSTKFHRLGKLVDEHMNVFHIETALNNAYGSPQVSTIYTPTNQYWVMMELLPQYQRDLSAMNLLHLTGRAGVSVPSRFDPRGFLPGDRARDSRTRGRSHPCGGDDAARARVRGRALRARFYRLHVAPPLVSAVARL